jgi:hypothetical protein
MGNSRKNRTVRGNTISSLFLSRSFHLANFPHTSTRWTVFSAPILYDSSILILSVIVSSWKKEEISFNWHQKRERETVISDNEMRERKQFTLFFDPLVHKLVTVCRLASLSKTLESERVMIRYRCQLVNSRLFLFHVWLVEYSKMFNNEGTFLYFVQKGLFFDENVTQKLLYFVFLL